VIIDICNFLSISTSIVEVHLKLEVNRRTGVAPIGRIYMHHRADGLLGVDIDALLESLILSLLGAGIGWLVALGLIGLIKEVGLQESIARADRVAFDITILVSHCT
jgi:hypothetical protein